MKNHIMVTGVVSSEPRMVATDEGFDICSFRLASMHVSHNPVTDTWVDQDVNWYVVTASGVLADNAHRSLKSGDRVVVCGGLRIHDWTTANASGAQAEIDATVIGQDLNWGSSDFYCSHEKTSSKHSAAEPHGEDRTTGDAREAGGPLVIADRIETIRPKSGTEVGI